VNEDDEIVREFLEESRDNLDQLDRDLVALEGNPTDPALLAQVFRTIHTIKGTCGFLGYVHLEALTHAGENLLTALRDGALVLDAAITTSLLRLGDAVRRVLGQIGATGTEGDDDHAAVVADLERHLAADRADVTDAVAAVEVEAAMTAADTTVRVDVAVLDKLLDLVGELVLTRTQIGELTDDEEESALSAPYRHLRLVTSELQEGVMRARLQPISVATGKIRRIVRDLAADLGKQILVDIDGEDVGVDKAVNEVLRDPLLHLVRNAVDHGIELPADRIAAGKPAEGRISLRAYHEGGRVHIVLADDGRGIDADRLVAKAVKSGMITMAAAAKLTSDEARQLIFRAGLSTKDDITTLSGRGVGMDVVQSTLEAVGGTITVASEPGVGTMMAVSLPLTLAIMPTLVVLCAGSRYAIPQSDIQEIVRVGELVDGCFRLRRSTLPAIDLAERLGVADTEATGGRPIVVVKANGMRFGIVVDAIDDTFDTIVKPLTTAMRSISVYAGVTILSDGNLALILDAAGLAASVAATDDSLVEDRVVFEEARATLLVAYDADDRRLAVPLDTVRRLEHLSGDAITSTDAGWVATYLGSPLPLIDVAGVLRGDRDAADLVQVVVCESTIGLVGLAVDKIDDVSAALTAADMGTRLLDLEGLVADAGLEKVS
jgi:two-component system chemotaxis sensor kinase CheA